MGKTNVPLTAARKKKRQHKCAPEFLNSSHISRKIMAKEPLFTVIIRTRINKIYFLSSTDHNVIRNG